MQASDPHILAIDLGTSGPKVALVSARGALRACALRPVQTLRIGPDGAEQDPEELWQSVAACIQQVVAEAQLPESAIAGIICVSQFSSVVPVDAQGRPTMNLVLWMDGRGAPHGQALYGQHDAAFMTWFERHGLMPLPNGTDSLSHMLYVMHERPDVYAATHKFLEPMDYLNLRLTGEMAANHCTAFMMLLTDNRALDRLEYDPELVRMSGLDPDKLPELRPLGSTIGKLRPEVASELGLPSGLPVLSAMNDTHAASVAAGAFRAGAGGINVGTTSQVLAHVDRKHTDLEAGILSMPSPFAGAYTLLAENGLGGGTLSHFVEQLALTSDALGSGASDDPYAGLEQALAQCAPAKDQVMYLPWIRGAQAPVNAPSMRGGFIHMSLHTARVDLVRAVLEGVMLNMRWLLEAAERSIDQQFPALRFSGGGARSDAWSQLAADVLNRPVHQLADARFTNVRAAAYFAFLQLGLVSERDFEQLCPVHRQYQPVPEHASIHAERFSQFRAAFDALRPISEALGSD